MGGLPIAGKIFLSLKTTKCLYSAGNANIKGRLSSSAMNVRQSNAIGRAAIEREHADMGTPLPQPSGIIFAAFATNFRQNNSTRMNSEEKAIRPQNLINTGVPECFSRKRKTGGEGSRTPVPYDSKMPEKL